MPDKAKPTAASNPTTPGVSEAPCSLREFWLYFIRLGTLGFGGPIALAGHMQRDLVEQRGWISRQNYMDGLAFSQLSPGPLAAQLAMYLGWIRGGFLGATLTGIAFILPSFLMVLLLAALYIHYGQLSWLQGMFYGIGAAVIAIIARSAHKLVRTTIGADPLLWVLFAVVTITTAWTESEIVWLFILSGIISLLVKAPPGMQANSTAVLRSMGIEWLFAGVHGTAAAGTLLALFLYFVKAGAFVFGSGLAIVPFLHSGAVTEHHWITEQQFLDAVAVAMITPGPVVITAAFIGYLVAGLAGATLAAVAVFAPPYFIVILAAPYYRRFAQNRQVKAFVQGVTAAAVGAIAGAAYILGRRALVDIPSSLIAIATFLILVWTRKIPEPALILTAGASGVILRYAGS